MAARKKRAKRPRRRLQVGRAVRAAKSVARQLGMRPRRNSPLEATPAMISRRGVLMSRRVLELSYYHALSNQARPYRHDFGAGVEMWAQPDGSIVLRHPTRRLWEDRNVSDKE